MTLCALMQLSRSSLEAGSAGIAEELNGALQPSSSHRGNCGKCNCLRFCGRHSIRECQEVWRRALPGKNAVMAGVGKAHQSSLTSPEKRLWATALQVQDGIKMSCWGFWGQELAIDRPAISGKSRALRCQSPLLACLGLWPGLHAVLHRQ